MEEEITSNVELSLFYYILCRAELQSLNFHYIPLGCDCENICMCNLRHKQAFLVESLPKDPEQFNLLQSSIFMTRD
jgi:hypothetical protein